MWVVVIGVPAHRLAHNAVKTALVGITSYGATISVRSSAYPNNISPIVTRNAEIEEIGK